MTVHDFGEWRASAACWLRTVAFVVAAAVLLGAYVGPLPASAATVRASVDSSGTQANGASQYAGLSEHGRYVVFQSAATNIVAGDTNGVADIFVRDNLSGTTTRASVDSSGTQANGASYYWPSISADGRYVVFSCSATNLVPGDTNSRSDVFVHDMVSGATTRVSVDSSGTQSNDESQNPSISDDDRYVAFFSTATNLVSGDTNNTWDVFVRDRTSGTTVRASVDSSGTQGNGGSYYPRISASGRYVVFHSGATNLVANDTNGGTYDIFVRDLVGNSTRLVSVNSSGTQGNYDSTWGSVSSDGRYVAFASSASNLVSGDANSSNDVFVRDTVSGTTTCTSVNSSGTPGDSTSLYPCMSADGRCVAFASYDADLVPGDTNGTGDIFVSDMVGGSTTRVSVDSSGTQANGASDSPAISADGLHVGFQSGATNLVSGDTNGAGDVFVRDLADSSPPVTTISSVPVGWVDHNVDFSLVATDSGGVGVAHTYFGLNTPATTAYTTTVTVTQEGTTTISYRSVDASGNAESTNTATAKIDKTAPATSDDHVASYSGTATITIAATDTMSGVACTRYSLDHGGVTTGTVVITGASGSHTLSYASQDAVGNAEATKTINFAIAGGSATIWCSTRMALTGSKKVRAGRPYKLKLWMSPRSAPESVRFTLRCVNHGRTIMVKTGTVRLRRGVGIYRFSPYYRGTWQFTARYAAHSTAGRVYRACSASKSITVR